MTGIEINPHVVHPSLTIFLWNTRLIEASGSRPRVLQQDLDVKSLLETQSLLGIDVVLVWAKWEFGSTITDALSEHEITHCKHAPWGHSYCDSKWFRGRCFPVDLILTVIFQEDVMNEKFIWDHLRKQLDCDTRWLAIETPTLTWFILGLSTNKHSTWVSTS